MARWQPNSRDRLTDAALALFDAHGFERTTAAQIAEHAGLTERTFFRHFGDKREVLFGRAQEMEDLLVASLGDGTPMASVAAGLGVVAAALEPRRDFLTRQHALIGAHPELQERDLIKQASWAAAIAHALTQRGVPSNVARLAGEVAIAAFRVAFERWIEPANTRSLADLAAESFSQLAALD